MIPLFVDFETRSDCDLKVRGGRLYAEHPSTDVICAVAGAPGGWTDVWVPGDDTPDWADEPVTAAHNAMNFDRFIWRRLGWPEPARWIDTMQLARRAGLPGALGKLASLEDEDAEDEKDTAGNALTLSLSGLTCRGDTKRKDGTIKKGVPPELKASLRAYHQARKALAREGRTGWPEVPADILERVIDYCRADVGSMVDAWPILQDWVDLEDDVEAAERAVNDRGIEFDHELASILLDRDDATRDGAIAAAGAALGVADLDSKDLAPKKLAGWFETLGVHIPNAQFDTIEELTRHPDPRVRAVAEARLSLASIARGKLTAGLARTSPDGRMRDAHVYYKAHTGRWAGQGFQVHNIPWINRRKDA